MADQIPETQLDDPVSFDSPPVGEVILGIQFTGPVVDDAAILGDFWPQIRSDHPVLNKAPQMDRINETFGLAPPGQRFELSLGEAEPQRYLFGSQDGHWLVQVQPDRFAMNWRRRNVGITYPRYRALRRRFEELYRIFTTTVDNERLKANPPEWCATTYLNYISAQDGGGAASRLSLDKILRFVHAPQSSVLPAVEDTIIQQRYVLVSPNVDEEPRGRLFIRAQPVVRANDQMPGYSLELRVLARPDGASRAAVMRRMDESRDLIVRSFKDITTAAMHRQWGLQEDE